MKNGKRLLAIVLIALIVVTTAPLSGFVGLELGTKAEAASYKVGDHIKFGNYPQSQVTDSALIKKLDAVKKTWKSYGYYSGKCTWNTSTNFGTMTSSNYMKYADFFYNGVKYRAVVFSKYRPQQSGYIQDADYSIQDDQGYYRNMIYYFRYEPLLWRVLNPSTGFVICEKAVDSQPFQNEVYYRYDEFWANNNANKFANDYSVSSIRKWLNHFFIDTAFTEAQKTLINESTLSNKADDPKFTGKNTSDKLFLLSTYDVNEKNGFSCDEYGTPCESANGTAYALCQGLANGSEVYDVVVGSPWWLRTAGMYSGAAYLIDGYGYMDSDGFVDNTMIGIRPACYLKSMKNDISMDNAVTVSTPTNLKVTATNTTALNLAWNKVTGATGYVVYQYNPSTKKYTKLGTTKTNSYKATNLKAGTTYQFAVKAYKSVDGKNYYSDYSALLKASTTAAKQFSFKSNDTNYILQHVSFIKNTLYKDSVKKDLRFAKTLWNTYHNGGGKAATEFAYDIMEGAYQTITFDFDYKAVANPYDLILLKLLADNSQTESEKEDFESKLIETFCTYFDKFLTLTQAEDEWSDADVKGALEDMIAFKEKNLDGNKLIQFFKKKVKNQNVSELMEAIFGKLSYYTDVVDTIGTIATGAQYVIDIFKTVSTIEAYRKTSNEFKTVLAEVKNEMTAHKDAHGKNFLKAYNIVTTDDISKIVTSLAAKKSLLFGADLCSDVAKEGIKSILKAKGMADAAISKLSAWLFAYEVGFMLGNMITGNDVAVACRRTMRAYYILESAMFNTLTKLESRLVLNQNLTNANTFDEAFNLFKKVQINFLDTHREFYENANKKIVVNWVTADGAISGSQIKITNKRKELWQKIVCHHKETDLTFRVADGVYTGKSVEPVVTVNCGYIELRNGTDFKVTYKNNVKIGKSAVATITGIGNYQGSKEITFSILPKKVSGLKVTAVDKTSLSLKWNKVGGATGYVVYRYNTSTKEYTKVGAIKTNTYKVTGLKAGKTYRFAVRAYRKVDGKNIYGSYSAFLKATTKK